MPRLIGQGPLLKKNLKRGFYPEVANSLIE
jgi:hypothetical protein